MTQDLLTACFEATGATPAQAEKAALAVREPDIITLLVDHQAAALVRMGRPLDKARAEALDAVAVFLADAQRMNIKDVGISLAMRQAKVYRLRCQGNPYTVICERLGICRKQADLDYRAEHQRRKVG